jgi:hypothetical protein
MIEEIHSEECMKGLVGIVVGAFLSALACGATFLLALYRQLALVEVAASIALGVELYFLAASVGDLIEQKPEPNKLRLVLSVGLAAAVMCYFLVAKHLQPAQPYAQTAQGEVSRQISQGWAAEDFGSRYLIKRTSLPRSL